MPSTSFLVPRYTISWTHLQALRGRHPGRPSGFNVRRTLGRGDLRVTEFTIVYEGRELNAVGLIEQTTSGCKDDRARHAALSSCQAVRILFIKQATADMLVTMGDLTSEPKSGLCSLLRIERSHFVG